MGGKLYCPQYQWTPNLAGSRLKVVEPQHTKYVTLRPRGYVTSKKLNLNLYNTLLWKNILWLEGLGFGDSFHQVI